MRGLLAAMVCVAAALAFVPAAPAAERVSIVLPTNATSRVQFAVERLRDALRAARLDPHVARSDEGEQRKIYINPPHSLPFVREGFQIGTAGLEILDVEQGNARRSALVTGIGATAGFRIRMGSHAHAGDLYVIAGDDSGVLYGCLELARRVRESGRLPDRIAFQNAPVMTLRGTCIGMQKTTILPGRRVYEYPYTPELFPWFYDKEHWIEYLDFLVENRMNSLYLWNGHPFSSLVRLEDYPEAIEVPEDVFEKNVEMFHWLTTECDKRGIWLVQMFYNIFLPKPLAEKHGLPTQLPASTPLAADYTRKAIAEFVRQYPNVGLMVCLGEALQGTTNQIFWATNTILPGVLDGMRAAGLREQPPVVIRTHAMNPQAIMPACFQVYSNLFTETKYNGESLTTYEPRGRSQATHLAMAELGPHLVNVHILSNLEPFRYGAQRFIRKSVIASLDRLGASGLHLYPLSYWNWPDTPDKLRQPMKQWDRDWIWFEAWARYAWNPDIPEEADRAYWVGRLADRYGTVRAAERILDAYNDAGEVAPMLIRRFGITEGNRQTLSLGMTLDQLVNPNCYGAITELWESQAPPGERLDVFVKREWAGEPHEGETPRSVVADTLRFSSNAVALISSIPQRDIARNRAEFERLQNDFRCIELMAQNYAEKVRAAERVLRYNFSKDIADMEAAERHMARSLDYFRELTQLTAATYSFANSMQTGHRKIPFGGAINGVGTNYHWTHVLPLYEKELEDFRARVAEMKDPTRATTQAPRAPWPAAKFTLLSTNAETYEVREGARPFMDRQYKLFNLAPELRGLTGIRFSHEKAKNGRYVPIEFEVREPVRVLIGYFQNEREIWLQVPNLDVASHADERGGVEPVLRNAASVEECPDVNVHAFRYEPGRHRLELIGKGSFIVLGVVPQSVELEKRDARLGAR